MKKRIVALFLVFTLFCGLFPHLPWLENVIGNASFLMKVSASGGYEDGCECPFCGHYHWGDYYCDGCGGCSSECTNDDCWYEWHCHECGECLEYGGSDGTYCSECRFCHDCGEGSHCTECFACYNGNEDELCGDCWRCSDCVDICPDCGFCTECQEADNMHCPECDNCYCDVEQCEYNGNHCQDCCQICEQCDRCIRGNDDELEICETCGLCTECCLANAEDAGCTCGEFCVDSSEFESHVCYNCGICFCDEEACEYCGLCESCCEGNSDCSAGMCVEDPEYEEHICEDCGACFCDVDVCEDCLTSGGVCRCMDCCAFLVEEEGCDGSCGEFWCITDPGLEEHIRKEHTEQSTAEHTASSDPLPRAAWAFNAVSHWHACRLCDLETHYTDNKPHLFNKKGICTVCGYQDGTSIYIAKQPKNAKCTVTFADCDDEMEDPLSPRRNKVTFRVEAYAETEITYQWYVNKNGKTDSRGQLLWTELSKELATDNYGTYWLIWCDEASDHLTITVPEDACNADYLYMCKLTDENGHTAMTSPAKLNASHYYLRNQFYGAEAKLTGSPTTLICGNRIMTVQASTGHYYVCLGDCDHRQSNQVYKHKFTDWRKINGVDKNNNSWMYRQCCECGYIEYVITHEHSYYDEDDFPNVDYTYESESKHRLMCTFPDCTETMTECHDWMGWNIVGYPSATEHGMVWRECRLCSYTQNYAPAKDSNGKLQQWTLESNLLDCENLKASKSIVFAGDTITLTKDIPQEKEASLGEWRIVNDFEVIVINPKTGAYTNVTKKFTFTPVDGARVWRTTIPSDIPFGARMEIEARWEECKHNQGTTIINQKDAICCTDGYTGDSVCKDCGTLLRKGSVIYSPGVHSGTLTKIAGTERAGTCTKAGYSGDSRCSACKKIVKGKSTGKVHGSTHLVGIVPATCTSYGYSGDSYCNNCGALVKKGRATDFSHNPTTIINAVTPTILKSGYTGDTYCRSCQKVVAYGHYLPKAKLTLDVDGKFACGSTVRVTKSTMENILKTDSDLWASYQKGEKPNFIWRLDGKRITDASISGDLGEQFAIPKSSSGSKVTVTMQMHGVSVQSKEALVVDGALSRIWISNDLLMDGLPWGITADELRSGYTANFIDESDDYEVDIYDITYQFNSNSPSTTINAEGSWWITVRFQVDPSIVTEDTELCFLGRPAMVTKENGMIAIKANMIQRKPENTYRKIEATGCSIQGVVDGSDLNAYKSKQKISVKLDDSWTVTPTSVNIVDAETNNITALSFGKRYQIRVYLPELGGGNHVNNSTKITIDGHPAYYAHVSLSSDYIYYYTRLHGFTQEPANARGFTGEYVSTSWALDQTPDKLEINYDGFGWVELDPTITEFGATSSGGGSNYLNFKLRATYTDDNMVVESNSFTLSWKEVETEHNYYKVTIKPNPADACIFIGADDVSEFDSYTDIVLREDAEIRTTVKENPGYQFAKWTINGAAYSTDRTIQLKVQKDMVIVAEMLETNCPSSKYTDTPSYTNWAHEGIDYCITNGLMNGVTATTFNPSGTMNRAMMVTVLYRMAGSPAVVGANTFSDVPAGQYYTDAVIWAAENGIVTGYTDGTFKPKNMVTREQLVTFLWRYAKWYGINVSKGVDLSTFPDSGNVHDYAKDAFAWAVQNGIITGNQVNGQVLLAPTNNSTRAQVATILMRYCKKYT